jgi:hypothetical protein
MKVFGSLKLKLVTQNRKSEWENEKEWGVRAYARISDKLKPEAPSGQH